jgi:hypothetical protein
MDGTIDSGAQRSQPTILKVETPTQQWVAAAEEDQVKTHFS